MCWKRGRGRRPLECEEDECPDFGHLGGYHAAVKLLLDLLDFFPILPGSVRDDFTTEK